MRFKNLTLDGTKAGPSHGLEDGHFEAYASVFGNVDSYGDVVVPGAFADSLKEWDASAHALPVLWGHNMADPDYNIGHVVEAVEDEHGLKVRAALDLESPKAAQVYRLLKAGRVSQMSFAFDVLEGAPAERDGVDVYELRRLKLYEVSVVPIGANQETEVLAVKSLADEMTAAVRSGREVPAPTIVALRGVRDALDRVISAADHPEKSGGTTDGNGEATPAGRKPEADPGAAARRLKLLELAGFDNDPKGE